MEIIQQLGPYPYLAVFIIGFLANAIIPVPEEVTLLTLGYLSATGMFQVFLIIPLLVLGLLINDCLLYWLSRKGSRFTTRFYQKFFEQRFNFLKDMDTPRLEKVVVFARFLTYFRFLAPFLAGMYKMPFRRFVYLETLSITLYTSIYVFLGFYLRNQIERVISGVNIFGHIITGIIVLVIFIIGFKYIKQYFMKSGIFLPVQKNKETSSEDVEIRELP